MQTHLRSALLIVAISLALGACKPSGEQTAPVAAKPAPVAAPAPTAVVPPVSPLDGPPKVTGELQDVLETSNRMVVGITYPSGLQRYPALAQVLSDYSYARRQELQREADALGNDNPAVPYDLTLSFQKLVDTPDLVAIAADGDLYTGGAHGQPLVMRYVWLAKENRMLTASELIPTSAGWVVVANYARQQLKMAAKERIEEDRALTTEEVAQLMSSDAKSIDEGTAAKPENFEHFEPLLDPQQKVRGLRFVFPPYQIGPYAYGVQSIDVPAAVLLPQVDPAYRGLFAP